MFEGGNLAVTGLRLQRFWAEEIPPREKQGHTKRDGMLSTMTPHQPMAAGFRLCLLEAQENSHLGADTTIGHAECADGGGL